MGLRPRLRARPRSVNFTDRPWHGVGPAITLLLASVAIISAAALHPSGRGDEYAVVAPPWYGWTETVRLVAGAGGDLIDFGALSNIVIVHAASPAFVRSSYRAGAWLVFDPVRLRGCLGFALPRPRTPRGP